MAENPQTISEKLKIHTVYKNKVGDRIPSVTTFLGVLGKPALLKWAWQCGIDGIDYEKLRDNAGDIGTLAHYLIMCHIAKEEPDVSEYSPADLDKAQTCIEKYFEWERGHDVEPLMLEEPLISETHQYGGTIDFFGLIDQVPTLMDFKTSKGIYDEAIHQVSAYHQLLIENGYLVDHVKILRIGKNPEEGFEERGMDVARLDLHFKMFLTCKRVYDLRKLIKKGG